MSDSQTPANCTLCGKSLFHHTTTNGFCLDDEGRPDTNKRFTTEAHAEPSVPEFGDSEGERLLSDMFYLADQSRKPEFPVTIFAGDLETFARRARNVLVAEYEEGLDDLFAACTDLANEKDIAANGPNQPNHRRSLHAVTLTLNEILKLRSDLHREAADADL